ncbi:MULTISPECIES: threonine/serine exporter family protein [Bacillaceae]|uniref:Uncharacterized membrane protein YjjB (DUF3815 family) n=1 Tax=Peribacillus huizhouensis TaxID=1501239 RepID=A0ABR6CSJ0_9BACI|nr:MULTISPECIES: threonine/serine exporter family protein [Bacillaceae]MBA9027994.1 uncharacterized membrane protein YjjB (DUF3815 family) [Peribacillus huizhouensis]
MIIQFITSFIASAAFGIIFNAPKETLVKCGFIGMAGWSVYYILYVRDVSSIVATLVASLVVAIISQFLAKLYKMPVIIFSVAGIIPLVPGGISYNAMRHFVENDYNTAIQLAAKVVMLSGAIAMGLLFSEVIHQLYQKVIRRRKETTALEKD